MMSQIFILSESISLNMCKYVLAYVIDHPKIS